MVTLKDVAQKAGVSEATVSLVLNERPGVSPKTRAKVLALAHELGYSPNAVARSLAMNKTSTIGLVVTDIENPFYGSLVHFLSEHAQKQNYSLLIAASGDEIENEDSIINVFLSRQVDGIIIVPSQNVRTNYQIFKMLKKRDIPFVFAVSYYPEYGDAFVMTDYRAGSYKLTKYLLSLGHKKIVHLTGPNSEAPLNKERIRGYHEALDECGLADKSEIISCSKADFFSGYQEVKQLLSVEKPDAIISINDIMILGARKAISEAGYKVPKDISIAGYDDVSFASIIETPLTTVKQNIEEIARLSIDLVIKKIEDHTIVRSRLLVAPELILRDTTAPHSDQGA
ncbi:MAG: LacI family DNA-binding transcriptional regulator [Sphaerochaetaceae bacterium]|nr:LacI family DNA-binding transcriptional regulator [Sphaerochaetaceae bacterium]